MAAILSSAGQPAAAPAKKHPADRLWYAVLAVSLSVPVLVALLIFRPVHLPPAVVPLFLQQALLAVPAADGAAPGDTPGWRPVLLPYRCQPADTPKDDSLNRCAATFRIIHRHEVGDEQAGGGQLHSLYIPAFQGSLAVTLNGVALASSLWHQSAVQIYSVVPMLLPLPSPLLHPGDNVIEISLARRQGIVNGFLDRIAIGPDTLLRPEYDRRFFLASTLPRMLDGWQIAMGLSMLVIWLARPKEQIFLAFGGVLLCHALSSAPAILGASANETLLRSAIMARLMAGSFILPISWLLVGQRPWVPLWVFVLLPLGLVSSYLTLPFDLHNRLLSFVIVPLILGMMMTALVVVVRAALTRRDLAATLLAGSAAAAALLAVHDALVVNDLLGENSRLLSVYASVCIMATASAVLIWRFARTMNALDRFGLRMKAEVAAAEEALRLSFAREQAQTRNAILQVERVRLMSDLHDGIAGQLVSILALCELRDSGSDPVALAVRGALADLRLVVASLEDSGDDLGVMLAMFRERIEPQLAALGMRLTWSMAPLPEIAGLHPGATLNIFRILQEAAINAARHSGSPVLAVKAGPSPLPGGGARLTVQDQGHGGVAPRPGSYGLANMRRRAETLGATLTIDSGPGGTTVTLDLPTHLP
ncbi:ATP-binding protein [Azospirillum sp. TSO35-2]|uniref:sensor histidine kinase n=1 Tax=Azospirillum sp. TSO35-2 TaxID=716796 RepID=UPI000D6202C8|nr:ATP-binding protein [Azospirillum sp. TSO35-2]PWC31273.1 hypothetical protein TSO352_31295 [Azospirillum sp. TSO35-2]